MRYYAVVVLGSALITYLFTPLSIIISKKCGAVKRPSKRDVHSTPTPELGGITMLFGAITAFFITECFPYFKGLFVSSEINEYIILICIISITCLGILDDIFNLDWFLKLIGQIIIASIVVVFGGIQLVAFPFGNGLIVGSGILFETITALVIVFSMNAVNFIDGLNGLASGVVLIGSSAFFIYTYIMSIQQGAMTYASLAGIILCILTGICIGFLPRNFGNNAKVFMGDGGSHLLGFLFSTSMILVVGQIDPGTSSSKQIVPIFLPIILPVLVFIFPILDMVVAIVRRGWGGKSPFYADAMHLHHRLYKLVGRKSQNKVVLLIYFWAFTVSYSCILYIFLRLRFAIIITIIILIINFAVSYYEIISAKNKMIEFYSESFRRRDEKIHRQ